MKTRLSLIFATLIASVAILTAQPPAVPPVPVDAKDAEIQKLQKEIQDEKDKQAADARPKNPLKRGAKPSPAHKLLAAPRFVSAEAAPDKFAVIPSKLSMWKNDTYGDCVTAQEAFAKAAWSVQCGLPEIFVPDAEVVRWASKYGYLNGANLTDVMDTMQKDGLTVDGVNYKDGPYFSVNYSAENDLRNAIYSGPVNIAIDADALPSGAGNKSGWYSLGHGRFPNTDHCVALCGYGTAEFLFQSLNVSVPAAVAGKSGYLLFTWNTIGFVDHEWLMNTCVEAWVRKPTTPGQEPKPPSPPDPPTPPVPPPPVVGNIVITVPANTPAGSYTIGQGGIGLTPEEVAQLQALVAKLGAFAPVDRLPPPGWLRDSRLSDALGDAMAKRGPEAAKAYAAVEGDRQAHPMLMRAVHRKMLQDSEGRKLLSNYKSGAPLPPGWLQDFLDWLLKNGPAIIDFIMQIMKLFGL